MHVRTQAAARPAIALVLSALLLAPAATPAVAADDGEVMSQEEFEAELDRAQGQVEAAVDAYRDGDRETALEEARAVEDRFRFDGNESSPFERKLKEVSAVSVGERVKALASQLESAIASNASVEDVEATADELKPTLNRLVLVAKGEAAPVSGRSLRTAEAIDAAAAEVLDHVDEAVSLYEDSETREGRDAARAEAKDAFFAYEANGLGSDVTSVDKPLEDRTENLIVNFQGGGELGLAGLIEEEAPLEDVRDQRDAIAQALDENVELLKATLPPQALGDADGDGEVTIVDALRVAQAALGVRESKDLMDANQDGRVTIVDALQVAQAALGIRDL